MNIQSKPCFKMYHGFRLITHIYKAHLGFDMTIQMVYVLTSLSKNKPITMNSLSKELELDSSAVSTLISRMEKKGLVVRTHGKEDRRVVFVALTENGESIKHLNQSNIEQMDKDIRSMLSQAEVEALESIVEKLNHTVIDLHNG